MKKNIQLSIPKPCHEKWSSFEPTRQGGFCSSCQKEVIDFTSWSEDRLKAHFKNSRTNTCGQFKPQQLTIYELESHRSASKGWFTVFLVTVLALFTSRQTTAQDVKPKPSTEQYEPEVKIGKMALTPPADITITGVVKDDSGELMPGVNIIRKGTAQGTVTDASGRFMLRLENPTPSEILIFSFVGFRTAEYVVTQDQLVQEFLVDMSLDVTRLGEVVLGGVMVDVPWYSPRRWW